MPVMAGVWTRIIPVSSVSLQASAYSVSPHLPGAVIPCCLPMADISFCVCLCAALLMVPSLCVRERLCRAR